MKEKKTKHTRRKEEKKKSKIKERNETEKSCTSKQHIWNFFKINYKHIRKTQNKTFLETPYCLKLFLILLAILLAIFLEEISKELFFHCKKRGMYLFRSWISELRKLQLSTASRRPMTPSTWSCARSLTSTTVDSEVRAWHRANLYTRQRRTDHRLVFAWHTWERGCLILSERAHLLHWSVSLALRRA